MKAFINGKSVFERLDSYLQSRVHPETSRLFPPVYGIFALFLLRRETDLSYYSPANIRETVDDVILPPNFPGEQPTYVPRRRSE